jgi:hypothetical protein
MCSGTGSPVTSPGPRVACPASPTSTWWAALVTRVARAFRIIAVAAIVLSAGALIRSGERHPAAAGPAN